MTLNSQYQLESDELVHDFFGRGEYFANTLRWLRLRFHVISINSVLSPVMMVFMKFLTVLAQSNSSWLILIWLSSDHRSTGMARVLQWPDTCQVFLVKISWHDPGADADLLRNLRTVKRQFGQNEQHQRFHHLLPLKVFPILNRLQSIFTKVSKECALSLRLVGLHHPCRGLMNARFFRVYAHHGTAL